jgi:peptidoglycan/xylan/chitin deacetylase (PgdA/CDA1 family)
MPNLLRVRPRLAPALTVTGLVALATLGSALGIRSVARSRTFQLVGRLVARVPTADSVVALTFDDGPTASRVDTLLGVLQSRGVRATFFLIGEAIASAPAAARALASAGHELGNHTYTHRHMVLHGVGTYRREVITTDSLLDAAGARRPILFRPPYGYKLVGLPYVLWRLGRTTITWDIEPESYPEDTRTPDHLVRHVLARVGPGSIILLHPWYASGTNTRAALPLLIDSLHARGYRIEPVGELLARENRPPPSR